MYYVAITAILVSAALVFFRLVIGPDVPDRIVAANAVGIMFFSIIILLTGLSGSDVFLDIALVYAILQFADVLIMARYLEGRERIERES